MFCMVSWTFYAMLPEMDKVEYKVGKTTYKRGRPYLSHADA